MKKQYIFLFIAVIFGLLTACQNPQTKNQQQPYLIVVSMDGFRWDYTDSVPTPNFDRLAQQGVHATSMQVSFPSKTFPNHYTLATGLTPDHHGIVNNNFYAPDLDEHYSLSKRSAVEDGRFYGGEPIWNTAKKNGIKTASFFWVGSEADIQGMRPDYWKRYNGKIPFKQRVDTVMHWLNLPTKQRPHLIMWYAHEPDYTGHAAGPHSPQTDSVVMLMDELLGYFMDRLAQQPMADSVNVIITSDHGMASITPEKCIYLDQHLKENWLANVKGGNPIFNIKAAPNCKDSIVQALRKVEGLQCLDNSDPHTQKTLQYGTHARCLDFTLVPDLGYSIKGRSYPKLSSKGAHGYSPAYKEMDAIFYAYGPSFKKGYTQKRFTNTAVYPLMCYLLGIPAAPNDGNLESVKNMTVVE